MVENALSAFSQLTCKHVAPTMRIREWFSPRGVKAIEKKYWSHRSKGPRKYFKHFNATQSGCKLFWMWLTLWQRSRLE